MPATFLAVGDVMVDVTATGTGHSARIALQAGGAAVNAAVSAATHGASARVVGRVGDDLPGRAIRGALADHGIAADLSTDSVAATGTFLLLDGEIRADRGANAHFEPDHLPQQLQADAILVSGYLPPATVAAALERAEGDWVALAPGRLDHLPKGPNAVLLDEVEARRLTGRTPRAAALVLGERFRLACVTSGADGAVAVLDGRVEAFAPPTVDNGASVGAGDAFAAAFLVDLVDGSDLHDALAAASRCGAAVAAGSARP
jgi:ribokinase